MSRVITFLTDFGPFYVSQMKGVILQRTDDVVFVDIATDIPPQDVRSGAFALMVASRYFPRGTIHIAVVDPGVGTERAAICVESGGHVFLGPDNGILMPAARALGSPVAWMLDVPDNASPTFHGRDIFAPAAAEIACGTPLRDIGRPFEPKDLDLGSPRVVANGIEANVIYVDNFGNVILNMRYLPDMDVRLMGRRLKRVRTYGEAGWNESLITLGSHGFAEIAVNGGSAAELFGLSTGDKIVLEDMSCSE
ncbi:MAG: SAM-dependent chlorinase/fluorinase [Methanothrix sp.]|uniref:SAM hydrolase/SAM-dependent halogenase family protein n=1 Tax=Methanothrix sp. TaxID=90426 RepID=UPI0025D48970|nr:SAM-dependent chlorinase/fluorinase [Methanothrix sp.]MCQ8903842.1 SAM-dependent chlorinase/fluorinase [Methanothrix sp.]